MSKRSDVEQLLWLAEMQKRANAKLRHWFQPDEAVGENANPADICSSRQGPVLRLEVIHKNEAKAAQLSDKLRDKIQSVARAQKWSFVKREQHEPRAATLGNIVVVPFDADKAQEIVKVAKLWWELHKGQTIMVRIDDGAAIPVVNVDQLKKTLES